MAAKGLAWISTETHLPKETLACVPTLAGFPAQIT